MPDIDISKNTGKTTPATDPKGVADVASANTNQQLAEQTTALQGTDTANASNAQAGFKKERVPPPAKNFNNGNPVNNDLDRMISEGKVQNIVLTGTTVNDPNPVTGVAVDTTTLGTASLFNDYWLVHYNSLAGKEKPVNFLGEDGREPYRGLAFDANYKNPTTSRIIEVFNGKGKGVNPWTKPEKKYTYSDFLYLKHYHPYNNNRLITLRRFLRPVFDDCTMPLPADATEDTQRRLKLPIAKALSYLGTSGNTLSTLANFTVTIPTSDPNGNTTDRPTMIGESELAKLNVFSTEKSGTDNNAFGYALMVALSGADKTDAINAWATKMDPWQNGAYADQLQGNVNVITGSKTRARGLGYTHSINLNFEYSTKYIERINPKAAMLDIISNMLAMTYHHANFYGGENRYQFGKTNFAFINNEKQAELLVKLAESKSGNQGSDALKLYAETLKYAGTNVLGNATTLVEELINGQGLDSPAWKKLTEQATNIALQMNQKLQSLDKTIKEGQKSTLNGSPTGEWHLQVGNPFAPIMMIGNLWCTSGTFTFNDDLSADDFPTDLKVSLRLEVGRKRDASDIQSMFNNGVGRIYYPYKDARDANKSSSYYNTESVFEQKPSEDKNANNQVTLTKDPMTKKNEAVQKTSPSNAAVEVVQPKNTNEKK